jgi:hypothetical protein
VRRAQRRGAPVSHPPAGGYVSSAACAFVVLGHPEPAAVLFGFARTLFDGFSTAHAKNELAAAARVALATELDDDELTALTARGAALSSDKVVDYLRTEVARVLTEIDE